MATTVKIATWNVENLFRPGGPYGPDNQVSYDQKLSNLAAGIHAMGADVLALQEIGSDGALADLKTAAGGGYSHHKRGTDDPRGIAVGFLSKVPLTAIDELTAFRPGAMVSVAAQPPDQHPVTAMSRGALTATVSFGGGFSVRIVTAHLKSKLLSYPAAPGKSRFAPHDEDERARVGGYALLRRTAEAVALRSFLNTVVEGTNQAAILLGDMNDEPAAATTQILHGPPGSELGTAGAARPDKGDEARLWNLAPLLADGRAYSRKQNGRPELIDHIFVSKEIVALTPTVDSVVDLFEGLPSITNDPGPRRNATVPDHAPQVVTFSVP